MSIEPIKLDIELSLYDHRGGNGSYLDWDSPLRLTARVLTVENGYFKDAIQSTSESHIPLEWKQIDDDHTQFTIPIKDRKTIHQLAVSLDEAGFPSILSQISSVKIKANEMLNTLDKLKRINDGPELGEVASRA